MASDHVPGALLAHYHPLLRGPRVCLRLVRPRDLGAIELDRRTEPTLIVVDRRQTNGLTELLCDALVAHAGAVVAGRAA